MTQEKQLTKFPELDAFALELKANGFTVILSEEPTTYFHFFKDGFLGYVQKGYYSGYDYSTQHKPSSEHGTAFEIESNTMELSVKMANKCLVKMPGWVRNRQNQKLRSEDKVILYASPEEFIQKQSWAKYYIL